MGEERRFSRGNKSFAGRKGNSQHRGGFKRDGFKRDGFKRDGFKRDGERREMNQGNPRYRKHDGDRRFRDDDRRFERNDRYGKSDSRRDGFKRDGFKRDGFKRDGERRFHDGERRFHDDDRRFDGDKRHNNNEHRFQNDKRHDSVKREGFKRDGFRQDRHRSDDRRPRRNSDGTMSFPSQNPYTDRRPNEPKMPKGLEWAMLSKEERERLRGLAKEHAENIGLHILAAYALLDEDVHAALEHAKWVAKQASRIDFARETLAFVAYRSGDYKLAGREFRTAMRMNGYLDYLPFIADCERGNGNLNKALDVCMSEDAKSLRGEVKAEMFLVYAGVLADLGHVDKAVELVHAMGRSRGLPGEYRMRAVQAEQYFLQEAGETDKAMALDDVLDRLEQQYSDIDEEDINPDDIVIDYDLEHLNDMMLEEAGISQDDAAFAPSDDTDTDSDDVQGASQHDEVEESSEETVEEPTHEESAEATDEVSE